MTIVDACEVQFSDPTKNCVEDACAKKCKQEKGHLASGRCILIDTCFCKYPC